MKATWPAAFGALVASTAAPIVGAAGGVILLGACTSCQSTVREAAIPVIAAGSFDGVEADQRAHRLYLGDSAAHGIDVVDISSTTPRFVRTIDVAGAPNGLAVAEDTHRLYAGLIGGSVAVIDTDESSPKFMQMIDRVTVDSLAADLLDYSAQKQRVYVATGQSGEVVGIDTTTNQVKERLAAKVPVEQPRFNPSDGLVYAASTETDSVVQINPASGKVTNTFKVAGCHPAGLAINPNRQLALITCSGSVALINLRNGAHEVTRAVTGGDIVSYNARADRFLVASPHDKSDSAVAVFYGDGQLLGTVAASPKTHAAAWDQEHGLVYAVSAAGLVSFTPAACEPPPDWLKLVAGGSIYLMPFFAFGTFLFWYARRRAGRRSEQPARPTWHQLQEEDLAAEQERMRELEDGIFGPQLNQGMRPEP